jgi:methionine-S-sulfoxide reductase
VQKFLLIQSSVFRKEISPDFRTNYLRNNFQFFNLPKVIYMANEKNLQVATFAGGCFWCMQGPFEALKGVESTRVGYTGGITKNPSYEEVCTGKTGHAEAIEISYDSNRISYKELLDVFWRNIDPTALNEQFTYRGTQYRTAIFYHTKEQKRIAEESKEELGRSGKFDKPIVTEIVEATQFYPAEDYHQEYYKRNPFRYELYKMGSGRAEYLNKKWRKK